VESIGFEEREVELGAVFAHAPQYSKVVISMFHPKPSWLSGPTVSMHPNIGGNMALINES
jgi:hypothetical protein